MVQHSTGLDCFMSPEDFADDTKVKEIYLRDVAESMKKTLGDSRVQVYDYIVSLVVHSGGLPLFT